MPLLSIRKIGERMDVSMGLWHLTETSVEEIMAEPCYALRQRLSELKSKQRKLETIATHALLFAMTENDGQVIKHDENGKPLLERYNISISHTKGLVALILSSNRNVSIDVEYRSERVNAVADRFLREDEEASTTDQRLLFWCAKETAYKFYSASDLTFMEMRTCDIEPTEKSLLVVHNLKDDQCLPVHCYMADDYILTYAIEL